MMSKLTLLSLCVLIFIGCQQKQSSNEGEPSTNQDTTAVSTPGLEIYGDTIGPEGVVSFAVLKQELETVDGFVKGKVAGKVVEVCQKKGCWMKVVLDNQDTVRITFKDYGFFVPKDCAGRTAIMEGIAYRDTIPVEHLRHFAEDEGKSPEYIESITEPKVVIAFEASGVILQ